MDVYLNDATHRPVLVADIENSSGRPAYVRARLQRDMHELLAYALASAGADPKDCSVSERGDGALVVLRPDASKARLTDACLSALPTRLRRLWAQHSELGRLRLRIALHAGDVTRTPEGSWLGDPVDTAFRLADAPAVKAALAGDPEAAMVLVVSDAWFGDAVRPGLGTTDVEDFAAVAVTAHGQRFAAWLALPRSVASPSTAIAVPAPSGTALEVPKGEVAVSPDGSVVPTDGTVAAGTATSAVRELPVAHDLPGIHVAGFQIFGGDQVGRDKTVLNHYAGRPRDRDDVADDDDRV